VRRDDPARVVRRWTSGAFDRHSLNCGWMRPQPAVFMRRSILQRLGLLDLSYSIAADYEFMLRLLKDDAHRVGYLPEVLVRMRVDGVSSRSARTMLQSSRGPARDACPRRGQARYTGGQETAKHPPVP